MGFHIGQTKYPAWLRFHRGTIRANGHKDRECYFEHPILWLFGLSWGSKWFLGFIRTGGTNDVRE